MLLEAILSFPGVGFGVGLEYFFAGAREKPLVAVTRKSQRVELPERAGAREAAYRFASLDYPATERRFNCHYAEFLPVAPEKLRPHDHAGVEFIYDSGHAQRAHDGEEHALEAGDAIYFDATEPHAYRRSGGRLCSAVVVTAS
jgi:hypothetical protein